MGMATCLDYSHPGPLIRWCGYGWDLWILSCECLGFSFDSWPCPQLMGQYIFSWTPSLRDGASAQTCSSFWSSVTCGEVSLKQIPAQGFVPRILSGPRTDAEAKAPIIWPPDAKSWLTWQDPDVGKNWRQKEKRAAEDEMVREHHQFNGHESKQTLGDSEGQGSLVCCSPWGHKESDRT